ncbi:phosphatidylglycerol/phosphatidylinositol transfer protein [Gigaspora margarita]|uniref:Phosphatidylglycerol/phosphatidylinositol transfer protein n=1 Tax=Gigaspora margarita TaxID=4874 RepID=A0A8H4ESZ0_GIGMA|nr:phosphatidylglycerol/phosphatidylinositol transfer protein [Gigaspora margarita]
MHKFFTFIIFLTLITFTISFPYSNFRRDSLSGYTQCSGSFPNEVTYFSFSPNPVVVGQKVTYYVTEVNTATIQQGATLNVTGSYQQHVVFNEVTDFCKEWIEVNGYKCPLEPGTYNLVVSELIHPGPNDPKNATIEYDLRVEVANPGDPKTILSCLEGKYPIYAP